MERIGGFGGKSDILAQNEVYGGSGDYYKTIHKWIKEATPADIKRVANEWLSDGEYALEIHPFPEMNANLSDKADRTTLPPLAATPPVKFPEVQEFTLSNGLKVMLAQRSSVPVINMNLVMDAGFAADQSSQTWYGKISNEYASGRNKDKKLNTDE